ncbi:MAG: PhzF family phenazine biosynthesis isomerase, partial [Desulfobacteraceae bacterium]|nr:PhzF family phenazine biosynthesis isomerase [Desulfobacteraceae bacterium]
MKPISIYQIDSFTNEKFKGNPAGVVLDADALSKDQMLVIAREMNNSETAFILSAQGDDHDVWLRYFTPATEVPICGHATIAAHFVRALENQMDSCVVLHKTGAGILPVEIIKKDMSYEII